MGDVFELSDCKGMPRQLCSQVYIVSSLGSQEQWHVNFEDPWMKSCGTTPTIENARTWGWTSWDPAAQDIVNEAHRQLCQALPDARSPSSK